MGLSLVRDQLGGDPEFNNLHSSQQNWQGRDEQVVLHFINDHCRFDGRNSCWSFYSCEYFLILLDMVELLLRKKWHDSGIKGGKHCICDHVEAVCDLIHVTSLHSFAGVK